MLPPPVDGGGQATVEVHLWLPAEQAAGSRDVEAATRLAVWLGVVPADATGEVAGGGDLLHKIQYGDLLSAAEVDRHGLAHHFGGPHDPLCRIIDIEKLTGGAAGAPADNLAVAGEPGLFTLADQSRNHMA